jgi:hypothetical protein
MRTILFLTTLFLLAPAPGRSHWPWLEPGSASDAARAYFGVYPADRMSGAQVNAMKNASFWAVTAKGAFEKLTPQAETNALALGAHDGVVMSYPFGVYAGHGPASLILFSAKAFRGKLATSSPEVLPLDIVPVAHAVVERGKPASFRLLRNGKPLAGATVAAYTAAQGEAHAAARKAAKAAGHDHGHEAKAHGANKEGNGELPPDALQATTNAAGEFTFTVPSAGAYQLHVSVREATPGTHNGKAYETVTLVSTLRFDVK